MEKEIGSNSINDEFSSLFAAMFESVKFQLSKKNLETKLDPHLTNITANCFRSGIAVKKSLEKAFSLFDQGANQNHIPSQYMVAHCYFYGEGVTKNERKGYDLARKITDKYPPTKNLTNSYFLHKLEDEEKTSKPFSSHGKKEVSSSPKKHDLLNNSTLLQNQYSQARKLLLDRSKDNKKNGFLLLENLADWGLPEAQYMLSRFYVDGDGSGPLNSSKSALLLARAIRNGYNFKEGYSKPTKSLDGFSGFTAIPGDMEFVLDGLGLNHVNTILNFFTIDQPSPLNKDDILEVIYGFGDNEKAKEFLKNGPLIEKILKASAADLGLEDLEKIKTALLWVTQDKNWDSKGGIFDRNQPFASTKAIREAIENRTKDSKGGIFGSSIKNIFLDETKESSLDKKRESNSISSSIEDFFYQNFFNKKISSETKERGSISFSISDFLPQKSFNKILEEVIALRNRGRIIQKQKEAEKKDSVKDDNFNEVEDDKRIKHMLESLMKLAQMLNKEKIEDYNDTKLSAQELKNYLDSRFIIIAEKPATKGCDNAIPFRIQAIKEAGWDRNIEKDGICEIKSMVMHKGKKILYFVMPSDENIVGGLSEAPEFTKLQFTINPLTVAEKLKEKEIKTKYEGIFVFVHESLCQNTEKLITNNCGSRYLTMVCEADLFKGILNLAFEGWHNIYKNNNELEEMCKLITKPNSKKNNLNMEVRGIYLNGDTKFTIKCDEEKKDKELKGEREPETNETKENTVKKPRSKVKNITGKRVSQSTTQIT